MAFDPATGHLFKNNLLIAHVKCEVCFGTWSLEDIFSNKVPRCPGTTCPNCENNSGWTRHLGPNNDEVVEECPDHLPDRPRKCQCPTKAEHLESCPEFWPGGLRRS